MYILCVCLFSALSCRVGTLQISIINSSYMTISKVRFNVIPSLNHIFQCNKIFLIFKKYYYSIFYTIPAAFILRDNKMVSMFVLSVVAIILHKDVL